MEQPLTAFIFGLGAALGLVPMCRLAAFRLNIVARPSADRWHKQPTPLMGGLAIFGSVLFGSFLFNIAEPLWLFLLTGGLISAIGLSDDVVPIKPSTKLIAEIVVASLLLFFGYRLEWSRLAGPRRDVDAVLDRRHDQRVQPARQHGRPVRRHRR